jgi:ribose transport system substrate-binding protein
MMKKFRLGMTLAASVAVMSLMLVGGVGLGTSSGASAPAPKGVVGWAALQAAVKSYEQPETKLFITTPLATAPQPGGTLIFLSCNIECTLTGAAFQAATKAVGWNYQQIVYNIDDPSTLITGLQQALQDKPTAVAVCCVAETEWESVIPAYQAAGIPIFGGEVTNTTINSTFINNDVGQAQYEQYGKELADWFIVDSKGQGDAYFSTVPEITGLNDSSIGFVKEVKARCKECKVSLGDLSPVDVNTGQSVPVTVAAIQRNPKINYVFTTNGEFFVGLAQKLKSLGLQKRVKIGGLEAINSNMQDIQNGTESAYVQYSIDVQAWYQMDAILRHAEGMPMVPGDELDSTQLLVKGGQFTVGYSTDTPTNYQAQFEALWHVSS